MQSLSRFPRHFSQKLRNILKFIQNYRRLHIAKRILRKNNARYITLLNVKSYYKGIVIKTVLGWHKNGHINYWKRIESPEVNIYSQLIFDKEATSSGGKTFSLINTAGKLNIYMQKMKLDPNLIPLTKINSKSIKDVNVTPETIKLLEEK